MKKLIFMSAAIMVAVAFTACGNKASKSDSTEQVVEVSSKAYACPMHPEIVSDTMTVCSICGMDLEKNPVYMKDSVHNHMDNHMDAEGKK